MLVRSLMVLCMMGNLAAAGEVGSRMLRPPDLSKLSKQQFQQLLSQSIAESPGVQIVRLGAQKAPSAICSIPLLKWKVDHPERFNMPRLPAGSKNIDRIGIAPPAPECQDE